MQKNRDVAMRFAQSTPNSQLLIKRFASNALPPPPPPPPSNCLYFRKLQERPHRNSLPNVPVYLFRQLWQLSEPNAHTLLTRWRTSAGWSFHNFIFFTSTNKNGGNTMRILFSKLALSLFFATIYGHAYIGNYCEQTKNVCYQIKADDKVVVNFTYPVISAKEKQMFLGTYAKTDNNFSITIKEAANKDSFMETTKKLKKMVIYKNIEEMCRLGTYKNYGKRYPLTPQGQAQCKKELEVTNEFQTIFQFINALKYSEDFFKNEIGSTLSDNFLLIGNSLHKINDSCKSTLVFTKEGSKVSSVVFDENKQFCFNRTIHDKCGGQGYNPESQKCENNIVLSKCGDGWLNSEQQYCSKNIAKNYYFLTDPRDSKKYKTVVIGKQTWMAQNLDYHGVDGFLGLCYGDEPKKQIKKPENCQKYGRLYDWEEAKKSCPNGWHLPSDAEWQTLMDFAGGKEIAGKKLKAKSGWSAYDFSKKTPKEPKCKWTEEKTDDRGRVTITEYDKCNTDEFSFSALPGSGNSNGFWQFETVGNGGYWWSATKKDYYVYCKEIKYNSDGVGLYNLDETSLCSVRCVQD
jgi:uncharacterized protein (TIGR02145 family)